MTHKEESDTFYDDSEEISNDRKTNKIEESVTRTIIPGHIMEKVKCKITDLKATSSESFCHVHFLKTLNRKTLECSLSFSLVILFTLIVPSKIHNSPKFPNQKFIYYLRPQ